MTAWTPADAHTITGGQELQVMTRRPDGSTRNPVTIWVVGVDDRVFIRSTNGRGAGWFRGATTTGTGQIATGRRTYDVTFSQVTSEEDLVAVDAAYRAKYGQYPSIVDHLHEDGPRSATLQVAPG